MQYFFGFHIKTLMNLKIFGAIFGIGAISPWIRACLSKTFYVTLLTSAFIAGP